MKLKFLFPVVLGAMVIACNNPKNGADNQAQSTISTTISKDSGVYFVNLKNGDTVTSPVIVQMGVKGMSVEPAGVYNAGKGHHHLIIDGSFTEKGQMVMKDSTHLHFGKGQTADTLKLSPGQHSLTLQFADGMHRSYGKDWSNTITITVKQ